MDWRKNKSVAKNQRKKEIEKRIEEHKKGRQRSRTFNEILALEREWERILDHDDKF